MNPFVAFASLFARRPAPAAQAMPSPSDRRREEVMRYRSFMAAETGRLLNDLSSQLTTIDSEIRSHLPALRARVREMARNDGYVRRFISLSRYNIGGPNGFTLQMDVLNDKGEPDTQANDKIEEGWDDFGRPENCAVDGHMTFRQLTDIAITYWRRDGEAFVRIVRDKKSRHGIRLQLIQPEAVDDSYNERLSNGNVVIMGVEVDAWRRPVAYHVTVMRPEPAEYGTAGFRKSRERIPAEDVVHIFDQEYADQTRGFPPIAPSMVRLHMLRGYEEAALINARISAAKVGFFSNKRDGGSEPYEAQELDTDGNTVTTVAPGTFEDIGDKEFQQFSPEYPSAQHEMFVNATLRGAASGTNLSFNMLANNLSEVNYSSIRAGVLDEREMWKLLQQTFVERILHPVFTAWLESAMLRGVVDLPLSKFAKCDRPRFVGRRWPWVDPLRDIEAEILEVEAGFKAPQDVAGEKGIDLDDTYRKIAAAKKLAEKYGITLKMDADLPDVFDDEGRPVRTKRSPQLELAIKHLVGAGANGNGKH